MTLFANLFFIGIVGAAIYYLYRYYTGTLCLEPEPESIVFQIIAEDEEVQIV